jgi:hypothetical protein
MLCFSLLGMRTILAWNDDIAHGLLPAKTSCCHISLPHLEPLLIPSLVLFTIALRDQHLILFLDPLFLPLETIPIFLEPILNTIRILILVLITLDK